MSGWEVRFSNSRKVPYFYNAETQQSTWDMPGGLTKEEIAALPGASLLQPKEVRASHILVKHSGSRRPSSWKEANRDNADTFGQLARTHSDCSSHDHDGDLGWFDATFSLRVGEISGVVDTQSGVHLILRTG
ncbi:rotamase-domain-containing protein [Lactifluus volemus]|nr:rotamase-domain-containing protein [Lactifluus volemus]